MCCAARERTTPWSIFRGEIRTDVIAESLLVIADRFNGLQRVRGFSAAAHLRRETGEAR